MKVIHLFYDFQFLHSKVLISDMNKWRNELFGENQIEFWIIGIKEGGDYKYYDLGDRFQFLFFNTPQKAILKFVKSFLKRKYLIIHGGNYNLWLPLFCLPSFVLRKIKWICWGSQINRGNSDMKSLIYYIVRKRVFRNLSQINFLISSEIESFKQNGYFNKALIFNPYFYSGYDIFLKYEINAESKSAEPFKKIMVGNSGHAVNNHHEAISLISEYTQNVQVVLPVSYGHKNYIDTLKIKATELLGDRVEFIENFLPMKDLVDKFYQTDALVMYADVQSGLYAIYAFLFLEKPVFLKKCSRLDLFFRELNIKCYYLENLSNDFVPDINLLKKNREIILSLLNSRQSFLCWQTFFNT